MIMMTSSFNSLVGGSVISVGIFRTFYTYIVFEVQPAKVTWAIDTYSRNVCIMEIARCDFIDDVSVAILNWDTSYKSTAKWCQ